MAARILKPETCGRISRISIFFQAISVFLGFEHTSSAILLQEVI